MNQLMLLVVVLVAFIYFGGSNVPKILRDNKNILLGVAIGLGICVSFTMRLEGWHTGEPLEKVTKGLGDDGRRWGDRRDGATRRATGPPQRYPTPPSLPTPVSPECKQ